MNTVADSVKWFTKLYEDVKFFLSNLKQFLLNLQQCVQSSFSVRYQKVIFDIAKKTNFLNTDIDSIEFILNHLLIFRRFWNTFYLIYNSVPKAVFLCVIKNDFRYCIENQLFEHCCKFHKNSKSWVIFFFRFWIYNSVPKAIFLYTIKKWSLKVKRKPSCNMLQILWNESQNWTKK